MKESLAVLGVFLTLAPASALELSRTKHPRMLPYGAENAKQIHARIHDQPWYLEIKRHLPKMYESNFEVAGRQLEAKAAIYVVERSQGFDEMLYRRAVGWLRTKKLPHDPWNGSNWLVVGQSLLLDALWRDMEAQGDIATRNAAIEVVVDTVNFLNRHVDAHPWVCSDYGNQGFLRMLPVYPAAILLRGHEPWGMQADAWWKRMEDFSSDKRDWYAAAHQMTLGGGGWPEGQGYHSYCGGLISMVAAAIHSATDWNLVDGGGGKTRNDVLRQSEYYFWTMLPGRRYFNLDNGTHSPSIQWGEKFHHLCAYGFLGSEKSLTKYLLDNNPPGRYGRDVSGPFVLGYDPTIKRFDPTELPRSRVFAGDFNGKEYPNGAGAVVWRTGWDEDATVLLVQARNRYTGHQHADAGSFYLFRKGFLVTENAGKPNAASQHHNTYLIDGQGMRHGNNPHTVHRVLEETPFDEGDILGHQTNDVFTYAKFAFGRSYPAMPDIARREIVVLHPNKNKDDPIIVVADRIRTPTTTRKSFLMHTRGKPVGAGTNMIMASDQSGRLFARVLSPANATWSGEVNGHAYRNRIESAGTNHQLLAVLQASTTNVSKMVDSNAVTGLQGVMVEDRCVVWAGEDLKAEIEFSHPKHSGNPLYVILGLQPRTKYQVAITRAGRSINVLLKLGGDVETSPLGVLAFYGSTGKVLPIDLTK